MALLDRALLDPFIVARGGRMRAQVVANHPVVGEQGVAGREDGGGGQSDWMSMIGFARSGTAVLPMCSITGSNAASSRWISTASAAY